MALSIVSPRFSFVQFTESDSTTSCFESIHTCLPVFELSDVSFQFIVNADDPAEATEVCSLDAGDIDIGVIRELIDCDAQSFDLELSPSFERFKISDTQVLFNVPNVFSGSTLFNLIGVGDCFYIRIKIDSDVGGSPSACSNCFQRIGDDCHTSVIDYGNDENSHGFNYCGGGPVENGGGDGVCAPLFIEFGAPSGSPISTLTVPWTASLQAAYGDVPNIQTWIYDASGVLVRAVIREELDTYPPTELRFDFGGPASGVIRIM